VAAVRVVPAVEELADIELHRVLRLRLVLQLLLRLALVVRVLQRIHPVIEALTVTTQFLVLSLLQAAVAADPVLQLAAQVVDQVVADLTLVLVVQALLGRVVMVVTALT
jgi:hypothetical protein